MHTLRGFSLLETLSGMMILMLLVAVALPGWQQSVRASRLQTYAARLNAGLLQARSEALRQQAAVYICAANLKSNLDVQGCLANPVKVANYLDWSEGVLLYRDNEGGRAGRYDSKESLFTVTAKDSGPRLRVSAPQFSIAPSGVVQGTLPVVFVLQYGNETGAGSCLKLSLSAPLRLEPSSC